MSLSKSSLLSPLARARGLGSSKDGTAHWWFQRLTALVMIPLLPWFLYSYLSNMLSGSRVDIALWFTSPVHSILLLVLLAAMFYHAKLGIQVIIEDYVHSHCHKTALLILNTVVFFALAAVSLMAILKLHIVGI